MPPRLPFLSDVLRSVDRSALNGQALPSVRYTIVGLSYRGYWTSQGRASQKGIEIDARAALSWVQSRYCSSPDEDVKIVLWGQSIGAGVATTAAAQYLQDSWKSTSQSWHQGKPSIQGLILETPFVSVRSMLIALYPQRWLPYRYLGPFLWNWWDSRAALMQIANSRDAKAPSESALKLLRVLILQAGKDELIPAEQAEELEGLCKELGFRQVSRKVIAGALHTEVITRSDGKKAVAEVLQTIGEDSSSTT